MTKTETSEYTPIPEYLNLVGYFRADVERPVPMLGRLLDLLGATFGDRVSFERDVDGYLQTRNPHSPCSARWKAEDDITLGRRYSLDYQRGENLRSLLGSPKVVPDDVRLIAAFFRQRRKGKGRRYLFDNVWHLGVSESESYPWHQRDFVCVVQISTHVFPPVKVVESRLARDFSDEVVRVWLDCGDLFYAMMSSYDYRYDMGGQDYLNGMLSGWHAHYCIENELWLEAKEARREKVRGIYNGQYLSPVHLDKLGGKEAFVNDLLKVRDRRSDLLTDLGDRGLILRLTPSPIDPTSRGLGQGCAQIATWVFRRFRDAGLFCR